ncbi:MAG: YbjN domain-containing protein [Balneolaceae bacterium]
MKNLIESLLREAGLEYEYATAGHGKHSYYFSGNFEEFSATLALTLNERDGYLFFYMIYPYDIPEDKIIPVSEYINRINYGDVFGAFVIDYVDFSVGYHLAIPFGLNMNENERWFTEYLVHGQEVMKEFHEGLLEVVDGHDPFEVLKEMGAVVTQIN